MERNAEELGVSRRQSCSILEFGFVKCGLEECVSSPDCFTGPKKSKHCFTLLSKLHLPFSLFLSSEYTEEQVLCNRLNRQADSRARVIFTKQDMKGM